MNPANADASAMDTVFNRMLRRAILTILQLAGGMHAALALPSETDLGCISPERLGCGCQIRLSEQSCPDFHQQPHLFTALDANAPLMLMMDGQEILLPHHQHIGDANKGDNPGRFADIYANAEFMIRIDYNPAASTCPKDNPDGCEYTDVHASILLQRSDGRTLQLEGRGTCGC